MAILKQNTFEGGTLTSAITPANSGGASGDALGAVYAPAGCAWTYATSVLGGVAAQASLSASAGGTISLGLTGQTTVYGRFRFRPVSGTFTGQQYLVAVRLASLANSGFSIRLDDSLHLRAMNRNGSGYPWTSTASLTVGTDYQVEFYVKRETAAGATDGHYGVKLWSSDGSTLLDSGTGTNQNWNMYGAAATFDNFQLGCQATSTTHVAHYDDIVLRDDGYPGPVVPASNVAPVANAGTDTTTPAAPPLVALNGSGSTDSDGVVAFYLWEQISGPTGGVLTSATSATAYFAPPATAGVCVFQLTVTDNDGASDTDTVSVTVTDAVIPSAAVNVWDGSAWVPASAVQGWDGATWV